MSSFIRRASLATLVMILAGSCGGPRVLPPDVKVNPSPRERYEIVLTVKGSPGRLRVTGEADFDIQNGECMPMADSIAGIKPDAKFHSRIVFSRRANSSYVGYLYADWPADENYYGQGTCHWYLVSVHTTIYRGKSERYANIRGQFVVDQKEQVSVCGLEGAHREICERVQSIDETNEDGKSNYVVVLRSRKVTL